MALIFIFIVVLTKKIIARAKAICCFLCGYLVWVLVNWIILVYFFAVLTLVLIH